ncbi:MAG: hypothetical protein ACE5FT_06390 [Candidatus Nanoarchaeia archaeon]
MDVEYNELRRLARLAVKPLRPVDTETSLKRLAKNSGVSVEDLEDRIKRATQPTRARRAVSNGPIRVVKPMKNRVPQALNISSAIEGLHAGRRLVIRKINAYVPFGTANEMFKRGGLTKARRHEGEENRTQRQLSQDRRDSYEGGEWKYGMDFVRPGGGNFKVWHYIDVAMGQLLFQAGVVSEPRAYQSAGSAYVDIPAFGNRPIHEVLVRDFVVCKGSTPTLEENERSFDFYVVEGCGKVLNFANKLYRIMPRDFDPTGLYPREDRTGREELLDFHAVASDLSVAKMVHDQNKGRKKPRKYLRTFPTLSKRDLLFLARAAQFVLIEDPRSQHNEDFYSRFKPPSQANLEQLFGDFEVYKRRTSAINIRATLYHDGKSGLWGLLENK